MAESDGGEFAPKDTQNRWVRAWGVHGVVLGVRCFPDGSSHGTPGLELDPSPSERFEAPRRKSRKHRGGVRASRHQDYLLLFIDTAKKKEVQNGG